jgi:uncharacterized protein YjbI with pentapeptide repeats
MRPRTLAALTAVGLAVAAPVAIAGQQSTTIGTGAKTCTLKPGADCRGVVHRWTVEHHGNLRKAKFTKADLRGADFRGADLRGADFRGAKLRHADFRGANLKGARLDVVKRVGKGANGAPGPSCYPNCQGADLTRAQLGLPELTAFIGADLSYADFSNANLTNAILDGANLRGADLAGTLLVYADLSFANLTRANLSGANLTNANFIDAFFGSAILSNAVWNNTTCPDGTVTSTGC